MFSKPYYHISQLLYFNLVFSVQSGLSIFSIQKYFKMPPLLLELKYGTYHSSSGKQNKHLFSVLFFLKKSQMSM